jgi:peptide/nickel transport system permease protein
MRLTDLLGPLRRGDPSRESYSVPSKYAEMSGEFRRSSLQTALASLRIVLSDWRGKVGVVLVGTYLLMGTVGVLVIPEPIAGAGPAYLGAFQDMSFPLGTNNQGQDLLGLIVYATTPMLKMVVAGGLFATTVATVTGTVSGYKGGRVDQIVTTFIDSAMAIPTLPLVIVLAAIFPVSNPFLVGVLVSINAWAGLSRTIRSQVLTIREESYVEAARVIGTPTWRVVYEEVTPQLMPYIAIHFMNLCRRVIFASVGLYFLGVLPYTSQNWGVMLNQAYSAGALTIDAYLHWLLVPMLTIIFFTVGLIFLAQSMDQVFNPRIRAKRADASATTKEEEGDVTADIR